MVYSWVLPVAGFLVLCGAAHAQVAVSGRVLDENGAAVPQAAVRFRSADAPEQQTEVSTGPGGNFAAVLPHPGNYRVTATARGFFSLRDTPVTIGQDSPTVQLVLNHLSEIL